MTIYVKYNNVDRMKNESTDLIDRMSVDRIVGRTDARRLVCIAP